ncbi:leucine-rich repeat transmembrane protein FLRT1 [Danaus plexippus plexippus]|uniref:Leucine-rich repeat transmembrane protein FLRT1 n=1 Tax=Danaus plexippus plexippus TaxID=278856 RepID=A0A212ERW4_DANPL|nr:leucine-rich repeat transmembrane protein FLRT1 [Danaus plexippus plexippus]
MALDNTTKPPPKPPKRCEILRCRIVCYEIPYFGENEDQIIKAVAAADVTCEDIAVELNEPTFKDSILPEFWLYQMRSKVSEMAIIGGNINYITPQAFLSPFSNNLKVLILEQLKLVSWDTYMLVGLSNLKKLYVKDCMIADISSNVLKPVNETLQYLDIKIINHWNPHNVTGRGDLELREVDFSFNYFYDVLKNTSFSKLGKCKVLFLNSCKITSIAKGTFDYLQSLEILYLNNNYLVTIADNLFKAILPHRPRIALQENYWHCDCLNVHLRSIQKSGLLIIDPLCHYPERIRGMTFTNFEKFCKSEIKTHEGDKSVSLQPVKNVSFTLYTNELCSDKNVSLYSSDSIRIITPSRSHRCKFNRMADLGLNIGATRTYSYVWTTKQWITPVFFMEQSPYTMLELEALEQPGIGLVWYQSSCYTDIYCVNRIPNVLKVFNVNSGARYTFCPFNITAGMIVQSECLFYDLGSFERKEYLNIVTYLCISLGCLTFGAVCVYAIIFKNPSLLRANKRVLFVKHRSIEALILPPSVPLRKNLIHESDNFVKHYIKNQNIFVLPGLGINTPNFIRSTSSTRSIVSDDGSYISALQPTEEQLKEWRANQNINQCDNGPSSSFDTPFSSFYDYESFPYYTLHSSQRVYEVPKEYNNNNFEKFN